MDNNYKDYNDNYISKAIITQLLLTKNQIYDLLGDHYYRNVPKVLKIEVTDTLVFEYNLLGNDEKEQKYFYELRQIIHKKVKNIEKVKSALEISKDNANE